MEVLEVLRWLKRVLAIENCDISCLCSHMKPIWAVNRSGIRYRGEFSTCPTSHFPQILQTSPGKSIILVIFITSLPLCATFEINSRALWELFHFSVHKCRSWVTKLRLMAACDNPVRAETSNAFHVPVGSFNDCKFHFDIRVILMNWGFTRGIVCGIVGSLKGFSAIIWRGL
jgi:hypothetical protein